MKPSLILRSLLLCFWLLPLLTFGQEEKIPADVLQTPYDAVYNHLYWLQPEHYDVDKSARSVYGFDDPKEARQVAIKIKQVLDGKGLYVRPAIIPTDPFYQDSLTKLGVYQLFPNKLPEISVERIDSTWHYSSETVEVINDLHRKTYPFGSSKLVDLFPKFGQIRFLGFALWQLFGLGILILLCFLAHRIVSWLLNRLINYVTSTKIKDHLETTVIRRIARVISLLFVVYLIRLFLPALLLPIEISSVILITLQIASIVFWVLLALRVVDFMMGVVKRFTQATQSMMDDQLLPILRRLLQVILVTAGIIQGLRALDINVTALIAGVSIGGLALALAAQDTVKNLIGSIMIFIDKPFQIGDFVVAGDVVGTIHEVGFRTTKIKGADTSIYSIPNGKLADMIINNKGLRAFRQFNKTIAIHYNTPPYLIEKFVEGIRKVLANHPLIRTDAIEVHLTNMNDSSLDIMINAYFITDSWSVELKCKHEAIMGIFKLAEALGVQFPFPSTSLYIESMPGNVPPSPYESDQNKVDAMLDQYIANYMNDLKSKYPEA